MEPPAELPFPQSLCHRCKFLRVIPGARTVFLMCTALPKKYPPQPVRQCVAFANKDPIT